MNASVTCIVDEGAQVGTALIGSKGSSMVVDVDGKRVMFNTGRSGRYLLHNMNQCGMKADSVDAVIISRPAIDQIGGLNNFMTNRTVPVDVFSTDEAWDCKRLLGGLISADNIGGIKKQPAGEDWIQLSEHLFLSPYVNQDTKETAIVLVTADGPVVFCACAQSGISDVLSIVSERFGKISALVGGIDLRKMKQPVVNEVAKTIREGFGIEDIRLNGCTAREGIQRMRVATSNDTIKDFFAGEVLEYEV